MLPTPQKPFMHKVGEGGMSLSGGEKQRIVLARILYSDVDVLLLDEPLSAVDGLMQKEIFENCLHKACEEGKTVLFNTHHLEVSDYDGKYLIVFTN